MTPRSPGSQREAAIRAWATRRSPQYRARRTEAKSKRALQVWCRANNWKVVFFEGRTGAPRTGIADAILVRIKPRNPDAIEIRLVQIKAGVSGLTGREITRLKDAARRVSVDWLLAACDGEVLHLLPQIAGPA